MSAITIDRATVEQALEALKSCSGVPHWPTFQTTIDALRAALAQEQAGPDLSRCPQCNGPADNGHDRSIPPSPYLCTQCMAESVQKSLPCPTPKMCEQHCCGGWCIPAARLISPGKPAP